MDMTQTKFTLKHLPPRQAVLIEGNHGLGKSQCVAQVAEELSQEKGIPYGFIDIRLAEREVGDLIGMPRDVAKMTVVIRTCTDGVWGEVEQELHNVTVNDLPSWFPRDKESRGILFLDELHYASKDVLNASLELSLDHRLNGTPLPDGWLVVAAGNSDQDVYGGTTINPALYSRFLRIPFNPTVPEWQAHANDIGVHRAVTTYIAKFSKDLDPPEKIEAGNIYPDRRAWVKLSNHMKHLAADKHDPLKDLDYLTLLAIGYVGRTTAVNFAEYCRKQFRVYSAEDILKKLNDEMIEEFKAMQPAELSFYTNELVDHIKKGDKELGREEGDNLARFFIAIPKEACSGFWIHWSKEHYASAVAWHKERKDVREYLLKVLKKSKAMA